MKDLHSLHVSKENQETINSTLIIFIVNSFSCVLFRNKNYLTGLRPTD